MDLSKGKQRKRIYGGGVKLLSECVCTCMSVYVCEQLYTTQKTEPIHGLSGQLGLCCCTDYTDPHLISALTRSLQFLLLLLAMSVMSIVLKEVNDSMVLHIHLQGFFRNLSVQSIVKQLYRMSSCFTAHNTKSFPNASCTADEELCVAASVSVTHFLF